MCEVDLLILFSDVNGLFSEDPNKNKNSVTKLEKVLSSFNPDYAYVHNTWFKASPYIFNTLEKHNVSTIVKLHNFRFDCTKSYFSSKHLKGQKTCPGCGMNKESTGIFNKYYKESILKSAIIIRYGKKYFKILNKKNLKILTLTNFHKNYLENMGFNKNNIFVHPNYLNSISNTSYNPKSGYIVYAGRVSLEKGVDKLIDSYLKIENPDFKLKIVGNGPEYRELKKEYEDEMINFMGEVTNETSREIINSSRAVVTATNLYEGQPTLLCEASSSGIPSIFPTNGGISEFFPSEYVLSYDPEKNDNLVDKLNIMNSSDLLKKVSQENKKYILKMLEESNYIYKFESILNE